MHEEVLLPGARDVRGVCDRADEETRADACVVACHPHPQHGGNKSDRRLVSLGAALTERGVDCLRFDYGEWDEGYGELEDARNAVRWAAERYDRVGLFGYSFGGCIALLTAATVDENIAAVSVLAPAPRLAADLDAVAALDEIRCPVQVCYGERDDLVDWRPVVDAAGERGFETHAFGADHHFVGQQEKIAAVVSGYLVPVLGDSA
ncbi:alpha/beta hydrolase [Haloarchaeobius sp. TZWWS8]|uniref:alpha/beta hydrolase n=1 Tax=Haloarchaeobius sp. TZWWS8 TaxID=3446121 RepID=UPI003EBF6D87